MNIKDLKVGDKVFIREDLEVYCNYGGCMYTNEMKSGVGSINEVFSDGLFKLKGIREQLYYTPEMIDWEKTKRLNNIKNSNRMENINTTDLAKEYLNSKFGYLNINKDVANENIFKEITQYGGYKKEVTKGVTYDGEEIVVKNNGEENDVEKAVMLLMLKNLGVTYSEIKKEVEKVKVKWRPQLDEKYYFINKYLEIDWYVWEGHAVDKLLFRCDNCFETRKDAEEKLEKIKEVLRGE